MSRITQLFGIRYPIIQGGMIWCAGAKLASAVSNAGGLGLIGAGSMRPNVLVEHIQKAKTLTSKPFGVNVPLLYKYSEQHIENALKLGVRIFFISAGSPKTYTPKLKAAGATVVHVTSTPELAQKCESAGVDAVVAEGFEAGGHNGRDEITTMCLVPQVREAVGIPVLAAGGIASGEAIVAALALGADGVQIGSLFAAAKESSAHPNFKNKIFEAKSGSTKLMMKKLVPVRLLDNVFSQQVASLEAAGASQESIAQFLGQGRSRIGMFEGDVNEGELEIGQVSAMIQKEKSVAEIFSDLILGIQRAQQRITSPEVI